MMYSLKRTLAVVLAVIMVFALVGCGKKKREIIQLTLSTEDSEAILKAAGIMLPDAETTEAAGTTVKWFGWWDSFHNYSEDEIVNTGYWTFSEKYGCEVEWVECTWAERFDKLATLVLGGTPPDSYPSHNETFPTYCLKGMFQPVDDYIDYNDPMWQGMKSFVDRYFTLNGQHFIIAVDNGFSDVVPYNRRVIEEWGFDDPAELFYNDEWTWQKFYEMCMDFSDPSEDRYALDDWAYSVAIMSSCGINIVSLDPESGKFVSNLDDPRLERASDLLYNLAKNECLYPMWDRGLQPRGNVTGTGTKEGLLLFGIRGTYAFTGPVDTVSSVWGDVTAGELMFAPLPRDENGDGLYYTRAESVGYCIVNDAENPEGVALLASCDRFKVLDPTVISIDKKQLKEIYMWNDEMLDMYDTCKAMAQDGTTALVDYGTGIGDKLYSVSDGLVVAARASAANAKTWAQGKESARVQIDYYIDELNKSIEEYEATH